MTTSIHCKKFRGLVLLLVSNIVLSGAVFAAEDAGEEKESATQGSITLEQIIVMAPRSLFRLRAQIERAEDTFYSNYNDLNMDDELDVNCRNIDYAGSRIAERECWPEFFGELVGRNTADALLGIDIVVPVKELAVLHSSRFDDLRDNIENIANRNPTVANSLMELELLKQKLKREREECMKKPAYLFLFRKCY